MMMQPSKEEYEICEKLKKCTDEKERKILEEKWVECVRRNPIPELNTHRNRGSSDYDVLRRIKNK